MTLNNFFIGISIVSALIPVVIGYRGRHILWYYAVLSLAMDATGVIMMQFRLPVHWSGNVFLLGEWLLISIYIINNIIEKKYRRRFFTGMAVLAAYFILNTIRKSVLTTNLEDGALFYTFFVIGLLGCFYSVIQGIEFLQIERSPMFIFSTGFLLYTSGSLIMLLVKRHLDKTDHALMLHLWYVHNLLNVLKNVALGYSLALLKRSRR